MSTGRRPLLVTVALALAVAAAVVVAPPAGADSPAIPDDPSLPWTDPAHQSPLEQLLSSLASDIAKRPVRVYCNGETDWTALGAKREFDPEGVGGFVDVRVYWWGEIAEDSMIAHLSPQACWHLWMFAKASLKPTKCQTTKTVSETVYETEYRLVRVRVQVTRRVRVKGKWVTKTVWVTKASWKPVRVAKTVTKEVPGPPAPCYGLAGAQPAGGWERYRNYAFGLLVFTHESIHLVFNRAGQLYLGARGETLAQCYGMQLVAWAAGRMGASPDDARSIARYAWNEIYPRYAGSAYWSAGCRENGPLDLTPNDGVWP